MKRKHSPLHDKWHKRVEGQIRHTINQHPEWFCLKDAIIKDICINSLAKRIVGEIVSGVNSETIAAKVNPSCERSVNDEDILKMPHQSGDVDASVSPDYTKEDLRYIIEGVGAGCLVSSLAQQCLRLMISKDELIESLKYQRDEILNALREIRNASEFTNLAHYRSALAIIRVEALKAKDNV